MFNNLPVSVTLDTRKVYIGYVQEMPDVPHDPYFSLILLLSGHRDEESKEEQGVSGYFRNQFPASGNFRLPSVSQVTERRSHRVAKAADARLQIRAGHRHNLLAITGDEYPFPLGLDRLRRFLELDEHGCSLVYAQAISLLRV
jgi:hypothetical protein